MRFYEIIEGEYADKAKKASKAHTRRLAKVDSVRVAKNDAQHDYQSKMRAANEKLKRLD